MKRIKILFSLIAFVAIMVSCNKEDSYSSETGTGHIVLGGIMLDSETLSVSSSTSRSGDGSDNASQYLREVNNDDFKNGFNVTMKYHDEEVFKYVMTQEEIDSMQKKDDEGTDTEGYSESEGSESTGENNTVVDWNDLMKPVELRAGTYLVSVSFSDLSKEGFDMPCYIGEENITLKKDETKTIENITCSLANSIFNVNYTDAFKEYFKDYNVSMTTSYGNEIVFAKDETRDAYLSPGKIDIYVTAKREGQSEAKYKLDLSKISDSTPEDGEDTDEDISNGVFKAKRKYTITLDVNADKAILKVSFSDEVSEEKTVSIDVSDVALNAKAPVMTGNNLVSGELVKIIEGSVGSEKYAVAINAEGVIKECILTTKSQYLLDKGWPARVDLASSEISEIENKNKLKELGLDIKGLTTNIDQFAWVDFSNVINSLTKENQIDLNLSVTDRFGKTTVDDFVVSATTTACEFAVSATENEAKFLGNTCMVDVSFIKGNPNNIKFSLEDGKVLNIVETQKVEGVSDGKEHHRVTLQGGSDIQFINPFNVKAKYLDYDLTAENLPVSMGILLDNGLYNVWAKRATVRLYNEVAENVIIQKKESDGNWVNVERVLNNGAELTAYDLTPDTQIELRAVNKVEETDITNELTFKTWNVADLPNGDMEDWTVGPNNMIGHGDTKLGWDLNYTYTHEPYRSWERWYPYTSSDIPHWDTVNELTTSLGKEQKSFSSFGTGDKRWTRYVANSGTIRTDGNGGGYAALVRTVGWGDGNTALGNSSDINIITPGELYLGFYTSAPQYGISFNGVPDGLRFDYKYITKASDRFTVQIQMYSGETLMVDQVLDSKDAVPVDNWTEKYIPFAYLNKQTEPTSLSIIFRSGTSTSKDDIRIFPSGANLTTGENVGSELYLDNIELIYE